MGDFHGYLEYVGERGCLEDILQIIAILQPFVN